MYFLMLNSDGNLVRVHETWLDAFIDLGFAFYLSPQS